MTVLVAGLLALLPAGAWDGPVALAVQAETSTLSRNRVVEAVLTEFDRRALPPTIVLAPREVSECGGQLQCLATLTQETAPEVHGLLILKNTAPGTWTASILDAPLVREISQRKPGRSSGVDLEIAATALDEDFAFTRAEDPSSVDRFAKTVAARFPMYEAPSLVGPTASVEPVLSPWFVGTEVASGVVAAVGLGIVIYGVTAQPVGTEICFASDGSCSPSPRWLRFGFASDPSQVSLTRAPNGDGALIVPLGYSLLTGATVTALTTLIFDNEVPWWQVLAGVGSTLLMYGIFEANDPPSNFSN